MQNWEWEFQAIEKWRVLSNVFLQEGKKEVREAIGRLVRKGCLRIHKPKKKIFCFTRDGLRIAYMLLSEEREKFYPVLDLISDKI